MGAETSRLGITVSRRVGNAVVRNRIKRRVREWFRREKDQFQTGVDLVVIARAGAANASTVVINEVLRRQLWDLGVNASHSTAGESTK
jgi:ribonuclease P protein component